MNLMFDLEKAICDWRQQWAAAGIKSSEILRELENHLREDIQIQMREGFEVQKAFENSVLRLGQATVIKAEFAKTGTARGALNRIRVGFCVLLVAAIVWLSGFTFATMGMSVAEWLVASSAVVTCLFVAAFWTHAVRFLPVIYNRRKRYAIEVALFVSGFICSNLLAHLFCLISSATLMARFFQRFGSGWFFQSQCSWLRHAESNMRCVAKPQLISQPLLNHSRGEFVAAFFGIGSSNVSRRDHGEIFPRRQPHHQIPLRIRTGVL
jgi:hypothetical protein